MTTPIRVGLVGANAKKGWAVGTHVPALTALDGFELAAVATTKIESAREAAAAFGVPKAYGSANELIADPDLDVVAVSVKVPYHYEIVKAALEADKHVYCEWPLGRTTEEAVELAQLAERRGLATVIGLQGRRSPKLRYLRDLLAQGAIGEPTYTSLAIEIGAAGGGKEFAADRAWAADRSNGVHMLSIFGGHNLDSLRYAVGDPVEVAATVAVRSPTATVIETGAQIDVTSPDVVLLTGRLERDVFATVAIQSGLPKGFGVRFEVHGTEGALLLEGGISLNLSDAQLALSGALRGGALEPLTVPDSYVIAPEIADGNARNVGALYLTLADGIAGKEIEPNFHTAVELHRIIDAVARSADEGARTSP